MLSDKEIDIIADRITEKIQLANKNDFYDEDIKGKSKIFVIFTFVIILLFSFCLYVVNLYNYVVLSGIKKPLIGIVMMIVVLVFYIALTIQLLSIFDNQKNSKDNIACFEKVCEVISLIFLIYGVLIYLISFVNLAIAYRISVIKCFEKTEILLTGWFNLEIIYFILSYTFATARKINRNNSSWSYNFFTLGIAELSLLISVISLFASISQ